MNRVYVQYKYNKKPKYGFGGKTIYSGLAAIALLVGVPFTLNLLQTDDTDIRRSADEEYEIVVDAIQQDNSGLVSFSINVIKDEEVTTEPYVSTWRVRGADQFLFQLNNSKVNSNYFERELLPGDYTIEIITIINDIEYVDEISLTVE